MNDLIIQNMSSWTDWPLAGGKFVNRNFHILQELKKRPEIRKILSLDFIPFTTKRAIRNFWENIVKGPNGKVLKQTLNSKLIKIDDKIYVYSTTKNCLQKQDEITNDIKNIAEKLKFENIIYWSYFPMFVAPFKKFNAKVKIFDAVDDWRENDILKPYSEILSKNYEIIAKKADCIFTVSKEIRQIFKTNQNVHWIPNGVDFNFFSKRTIGNPLKEIKKPIIGYVGQIEKRLDFKLLEYLASKNEFLLVLIGLVWKNADVSKLKTFKNVHFLGQKDYSQLPSYLQNFDVGIIPHKTDGFAKTMNPLKMYEYLAAGIPVVSTPVSGVDQFKEIIHVADTKEDFFQEIKKALRENEELGVRKRLQKSRQSAVNQYTWKSRMNTMLSRIIS